MAVMWGMENFNQKWGEARNGGIGFMIGEMGNFLKSLARLFYEDPLYCLYGSTHVEPWYLSTGRILIYVLCNKASSLLSSDTCDFFTGALI